MKIKFVDFWPTFDPINDPIFSIFIKKYGFVCDDKNPDLLVFSVFGNEFLKYQNCIKLFYAAENIKYHHYFIFQCLVLKEMIILLTNNIKFLIRT